MRFSEIKKQIKNYEPALIMEDVISERTRSRLVKAIFIVLIILVAVGAFVPGAPVDKISGAFLVLAAFEIVLFLFETYYHSHYFHGMDTVINEEHVKSGEEPVEFEVAEIAYRTNGDDITKGFLESAVAGFIMLRLGLRGEDIDGFLNSRKTVLDESLFEVVAGESEGGISVVDYASAVFSADREFSQFLFGKEIQEKEFTGASEWVERSLHRAMQAERFWSRDSLGRVQGVAKDWAYGTAFVLERFGRNVANSADSAAVEQKMFYSDETQEIESVLSRDRAGNAILISDDRVAKESILSIFAEKIREGSILPALEHKKLVVLDTNALVSTAQEKTNLEALMMKIFNETAKAGNIILVIQDLPSFIQSAKILGTDIINVLTPFLESPSVQVLAMSDVAPYHEYAENNPELSQLFEKVSVRPTDARNIVLSLQSQALLLEWKNGVFFTYQAMLAIAEGADKYFTSGTPLDKALSILSEAVPVALKNKKPLIERSDIEGMLGKATGIPMGEVSEDEKDKLLNLETILHKRIVAQDEAVSAIADAMRRARTGVESDKRPMGSFLFLGPTGVGKTETTKALAAAFFDSEDRIVRLDMSEYQSDDSMNRLLGSFGSGKPGILSSLLRDHPYGVLLLDEFEKADKEVHNLFLQILDEGFFSDMEGKKVNARNLIIIATSNAGSDMIFKIVQDGGKLSDHRDEIIDALVSRGIFKPELLNRFDGVILFQPLGENELRKIALIMLGDLQKRMQAKGIILQITDDLVDVVVSAGTDPKFGARPMNRAVNDKVEQVIAKKIIKGEAKPGSVLSLSAADLR